MGLLSSLTEIVTSGVTWAANKLISTGTWVIAGGTAIMTWITSKLVEGITSLVQPLIEGLPDLASGFTGFGLWVFGLTVAPLLVPIFAGNSIRFIIRRIPVIG